MTESKQASKVERGHVLIVDDDEEMVSFLAEGLGRRGFAVRSAVSAAEALGVLKGESADAVVTDLNMPGVSGTQLCESIAAQWPDTPVLVLTGFGSLETAVAAIRAGAYDFITKPVEIDVVELALERALRQRRASLEVKQLRRGVHSPDGIVGESDVMRRVTDMAERVADTDTSVLLMGESGTGKEVIARSIHNQSRRATGPFVALNCAALPEALLESELFGYEKGAFTDARKARVGLFLQANRGTLFLDEIGDMPLSLQPKLLRVLQDLRVRPLGGERELPIDVRVISATHHDLEARVTSGEFRDDLYYRIAVVTIALPPLRDRGNDVILLVRKFVEHFASKLGRPVTGLSSAAMSALLKYEFPGNVRELQNVIERAVALTRTSEIQLDDLPSRVVHPRASESPDDPGPEPLTLEAVERRHIQRVLDSVGGNKSHAAQLLGVDRKTLSRKLDKSSE